MYPAPFIVVIGEDKFAASKLWDSWNTKWNGNASIEKQLHSWKTFAFEARWAIFWVLSDQLEQKLSKTLFIRQAQYYILPLILHF